LQNISTMPPWGEVKPPPRLMKRESMCPLAGTSPKEENAAVAKHGRTSAENTEPALDLVRACCVDLEVHLSRVVPPDAVLVLTDPSGRWRCCRTVEPEHSRGRAGGQ
jgi:hypothetical protein